MANNKSIVLSCKNCEDKPKLIQSKKLKHGVIKSPDGKEVRQVFVYDLICSKCDHIHPELKFVTDRI
ncbi:MAG: hypothetical protein WC390_07290 [Sulfurimonas sp.]|jgi:hypothetical protein